MSSYPIWCSHCHNLVAPDPGHVSCPFVSPDGSTCPVWRLHHNCVRPHFARCHEGEPIPEGYCYAVPSASSQPATRRALKASATSFVPLLAAAFTLQARVSCCSKFYQAKLFSVGIAAAEHSAAATEHSAEVLLLRCRRRRARSRNRRSRALLLLQYSAGGMSACPAHPSLQRAGWLLQSTVLLLRSALKQRSRSSAQRPRGPSLATKRRLLQSSAEEDAQTIPQLRLHPRLGTKND